MWDGVFRNSCNHADNKRDKIAMRIESRSDGGDNRTDNNRTDKAAPMRIESRKECGLPLWAIVFPCCVATKMMPVMRLRLAMYNIRLLSIRAVDVLEFA